MTEPGQRTLKNTLQGSLSGLFVEFDHLPWLLGNLGEPGRSGPDWEDVLHDVRDGMDEQGVEWIDGLPPYPMVERPSLHEAVVGARQLCERVGLIKEDALTDSGRKVAVLQGLGPDARRNLLASILAKGIEPALVGQDDTPLVPLLRDAARRVSDAKSPWAQQIPGLLPVEVAAIIHWACLDIERAHALIRDIEDYRDLAMKGEDPLDAGGISSENAEYTYDATTELFREHRDLLGPVEVAFVEIFAPAWLLVYCGIFEGVSVYAPYMEQFYLAPR